MPGVFRLVNQQLGGQIGWLIPLALIGFVVAVMQTRFRRGFDIRQRALLVWGFWFLPAAVFFSVDRSFHSYYMVMLAPTVAALVGIAVAALWHDFQRPGWRGWLLPVTLLIDTAVEVFILSVYPSWSSWLAPLLIALSLSFSGILIVLRLAIDLRRGRWAGRPLLLGSAAALALLTLVIAPAVWSGETPAQGATGAMPVGGPSGRAGLFGGFGAAVVRPEPGAVGDAVPGVNTKLLGYLEAHRGNDRFLLAVPNAGSASPYILATGQPVVALGGFSGGDPILSVAGLQQMLQQGQVRFFLLSGARSGGAAPAAGGFGFDLPGQAPRDGGQAPSAGSGGRRRATLGQAPDFGGLASGGETLRPGTAEAGQAGQSPFGGVGGAPGDFSGGFLGGFGRQSAIESWVSANCAPVPASAWGQTSGAA